MNRDKISRIKSSYAGMRAHDLVGANSLTYSNLGTPNRQYIRIPEFRMRWLGLFFNW
jgi:hypothetical protein